MIPLLYRLSYSAPQTRNTLNIRRRAGAVKRWTRPIGRRKVALHAAPRRLRRRGPTT